VTDDHCDGSLFPKSKWGKKLPVGLPKLGRKIGIFAFGWRSASSAAISPQGKKWALALEVHCNFIKLIYLEV
jgi:hypothetical protein